MDSPFKNYSDSDISAMVEGMENGILDFTFTDLKEVQSELVNRRMSSRYMAIVSSLMQDIIENGGVNEEQGNKAETSPFESSLALLMNKKQTPKKLDLSETQLLPIARRVEPKSAEEKPPTPIKTREVPIIPVYKEDAPKKVEVSQEEHIADIQEKTREALFGNFQPAPTKNEIVKSAANDFPMMKFASGYLKVIAWVLTVLTFAVATYAILEFYSEAIDYIIYISVGALILSFHWILIFYTWAENLQWKIKLASKNK